MSGGADDVEEVIKITDPGELNRDQHTRADRFVVQIGNAFAWIFPILVIAIVAQVILRKSGVNQAWLDDLQWWLYGLAMMAGFAYAITTNSHVRVDIFHAHFSREKQARIELFGLGWLLLPFLLIMTDVLLHYGLSSIEAREGSDSPNGLHGLFILKTLLPLLFVVAIVATVSAMKRYLLHLTAPALWKLLLAGLPGFWFLAERASYYLLWWILRLSNPDITPRKISKDPLLEGSIWYGTALIAVLILASLALGRRNGKDA